MVVSNPRGAATTEYALIIAAVALVVFGGYLALGRSVSSLASGVDSTLTAATNRTAGSQSTPGP